MIAALSLLDIILHKGMRNVTYSEVFSFILIIFAVSLFTVRAEAADGFVRISREAEFNKLVVGRKLYLDKNYFTIRKKRKS